MQRVIQIVVVSSFVSYALAALGDIRITEGGSHGRLEFQDDDGSWGTVCKDGFNDDAGDVACDQLGYIRATDVYTYGYSPPQTKPNLCYVSCSGYESALIYCSSLTYAYGTCGCTEIVGITCTNTLTTGAIVGIVIGSVAFVALVVFCILACICVSRRRYRTTTIIVSERAPILTTTSASTNSAAQPSAPPPYTTDKYV